MTIEVREATPEEYAEAGRVTAAAYREFVRNADWEEYLGRIADVADRAARTTILVAIEDGAILGSLTLELGTRVRDDDERPLDPDEAHGRRRITLNTTPRMRAAQEMYASLGYRRLEDRVFPDGFVLLGYEKTL